MTVTRDKIRRWIDRASDEDDYMVVHSDNFSHEYYPTYHRNYTKTVNKVNAARAETMHSVIEVYDLTGDIESQVEAKRTFKI